MLAAIDLTYRQAVRVLEQALRTQARVEIDSRAREGTLTGTLVGRQDDLLNVDLHDCGEDWPVAGLIGAFCDVRTVLSAQLYLFSTCIIDALDNVTPQRLLLALPEVVQVANRRRFNRLAPSDQVMVQLSIAGLAQPVFGLLSMISLRGLSCRVPRRECEDALLIDDEINLCFELPGEPVFELPAIVCAKNAAGDTDFLDLGLEFSGTPQMGPTLARLRAALSEGYSESPNTEGQS